MYSKLKLANFLLPEQDCTLLRVSVNCFYINTDFVITKLSSDLKTTSTFIKRTDFEWTPVFIYCSMITGDILVGMVGRSPGKQNQNQ